MFLARSWRWSAALCSAALLCGGACVQRPVDSPPQREFIEDWGRIYLSSEKEVDLLFVIDNSSSMEEEQANLARQFPRLVEALRSPALGNQLPNIRIGVVSTDLGSGTFYENTSCEREGGDRGQLQHLPRVPGCTPPEDPWIEYSEDRTNIPGEGDPLEQVKDSFSCIARLGAEGCGFEQPLEAARRALDPALNINPGFLRREALLAIIFITDEDDCSAQKPGLFDPRNEELGPVASFRCARHGLACDHAPDQPGPWEGCKPGGDWLYRAEDYVRFFQEIKPPGRVIMAAIAGPVEPVAVGLTDGVLELKPSCGSASGSATPAIRLQQVVSAFGDNGQFNPGAVNICSQDFGGALQHIGEKIRIAETSRCIDQPLTALGGLACGEGDLLGLEPGGAEIRCERDCLQEVDCVVSMTGHSAQLASVPRCEASNFADPADQHCGELCPCWRVIRRENCAKSPYAVDLLFSDEMPPGGMARVSCATVRVPATGLASIPQCF